MEEFDDDDFSDLYADVEVQASSAISALHRSTELPPRSDRISENAAQGEKKAAERDASREEGDGKGGGGSDLRHLSVENGDRRESASWSESEDNLASSGDGVEKKVDDDYECEKYDDRASDVGFGEISGQEKSVNGGDSSSQRKIQHNFLNSKMKRVNERAQQVHITCRKGDADDGREDSLPNCGRKQGQTFDSQRNKEANYHVPLDSDKRGSVQISDSVEDSPSELSECDSDGISETSDDTNRRKASCIPNRVSSALEPESHERGWSQHDQGHSCSASRAALSSRYSEKSHIRSRYSSPSLRRESQEPIAQKYSSPSLRRESQEPIAQKYRPPKDSERCGVRGTGDGRYHERWIDSTQEHSNHPKRSNYNRPDEDSSYATNAKHLYNRHVNHGKHRDMVNLKYNDSCVPYYSHSERIMAYSDGRLYDHHFGPAFWKDQYWDIPNYRYQPGHPDGHNVSERQNLSDKKGSMDSEALGYNRYHNQRRHPFHGDIEGVRNFSPKYSSAVDQSGSQFMHREGVHLRRTRQDFLSPLHDHDDRFVGGKYGRTRPSSGGARDNDLYNDHDRRIQPDRVNCRYNQLVAHDRREVDSSGRGKRRHRSPVSREDLCYIDTEVNERKNIKHQPFPFKSSEEPYASDRGVFLGAPGPKFGVARRNMRCSWKEMCIESDQYGTDVTTFVTRESLRYHPPEDFHVRRRDFPPSSNTNITRESMKGNQYQNHFVRRRHNQHSEVLLPREDEYKSWKQDNIVFGSEEPSHNFKRMSKNDEADDRPAFGHVTKVNKRERGRKNSEISREEDISDHFDGCHETPKLNSHEQTHSSHKESVDWLVVVGRKCTLQSSIRRTTEAGEDTYYGRSDLVGLTVNKEPNNLVDLDGSEPEETVTNEVKPDSSLSIKNQPSKYSENKLNLSLEIEEGQINNEETKNKDASQMNATSNNNGVVEKLDDEKIKEIMVKMERRRERFKEPITMSKDGEKTSSLLLDSNVETEVAEARLQRPARKRRWLGT